MPCLNLCHIIGIHALRAVLIRCAAGSEDQAHCTGSRQEVIEREGGIWGSNPDKNPFHDYFKVTLDYPMKELCSLCVARRWTIWFDDIQVYVHSCSSDSFSGTRDSSTSTGIISTFTRDWDTLILLKLRPKFGFSIFRESPLQRT